MGIIETATEWAEKIANDNTHGYDQVQRWSPDYDCSSLVISAYKYAGVNTGATYTGNMKAKFLKAGFTDVSSKVNLHTGNGLIRGDVLLVVNSKHHHTAIYTGNGYEVEASINENGTTKGGKTGDQTEKEILIRKFRTNFYTTVLRYSEPKSSAELTTIAISVINGEFGNGAERKKKIEALGYNYKEVQSLVNKMIKG